MVFHRKQRIDTLVKNLSIVDIRDFGAIASANFDNTEAIMKAYNSNASIIEIKDGIYGVGPSGLNFNIEGKTIRGNGTLKAITTATQGFPSFLGSRNQTLIALTASKQVIEGLKFDGSDFQHNGVIIFNANDVIFQNLEITNFDSLERACGGIQIQYCKFLDLNVHHNNGQTTARGLVIGRNGAVSEKASHCLIKNVISRFNGDLVNGDGGTGIAMIGDHNIAINCESSDNGGSGIIPVTLNNLDQEIDDTFHNKIIDCRCYRNRFHGIQADGVPQTYNFYTQIQGNTCVENANAGIMLPNVDGGLVEGNICINNVEAGIDLAKSNFNNNIKNNFISGGKVGIKVVAQGENFAFTSIKDNFIKDATEYGIRLQITSGDIEDSIIESNRVVNCQNSFWLVHVAGNNMRRIQLKNNSAEGSINTSYRVTTTGTPGTETADIDAIGNFARGGSTNFTSGILNTSLNNSWD